MAARDAGNKNTNITEEKRMQNEKCRMQNEGMEAFDAAMDLVRGGISPDFKKGIKLRSLRFDNQEMFGAVVDGVRYVALKPICDGIGLSWDGQYRKITLNKRYCHMSIPFETAGGKQDMVCIPLKKLDGWLFSINPDKCKGDIREKVEYYQEECFAALYEYWHEGVAINPGKVRNASAMKETLEGYLASNRRRTGKRIPLTREFREEVFREAKEYGGGTAMANKLGLGNDTINRIIRGDNKSIMGGLYEFIRAQSGALAGSPRGHGRSPSIDSLRERQEKEDAGNPPEADKIDGHTSAQSGALDGVPASPGNDGHTSAYWKGKSEGLSEFVGRLMPLVEEALKVVKGGAK
jgi:hypothetical protein